MARRSTAVVVRRDPAPVIRIAPPRPLAAPKRRRSSGRSRSKSLGTSSMLGVAMGAGALALVEKSGLSIPTVPILGRAGTIALVAYFVHKQTRSPLARDVALAGAVLAGYQLAKEGKIEGDDAPPDFSGVV